MCKTTENKADAPIDRYAIEHPSGRVYAYRDRAARDRAVEKYSGYISGCLTPMAPDRLTDRQIANAIEAAS